MIAWLDPTFESQPAGALALLHRARLAAPGNSVLLAKLGNVHLDRYDFAAAAEAFRAVLEIEPANTASRVRLARCYNELGRPAECVAILDPAGLRDDELNESHLLYQRAVALNAQGKADEAESELRRVLGNDPHNLHACTLFTRILRKSGRVREMLAECEALAAKGVCHAQLLMEWGCACALNGETRSARALLFDHSRVFDSELPPPASFPGSPEFNAAFAEELMTSPVILSEFTKDDANRGSRRIHHLISGKRPELVRAFARAIEQAVDRFVAALPASSGSFDPWARAAPAAARLHCWGLIQRGGEFEEWHFHRGGWLSGVYYVQIPEPFSVEGDGAGCLEFGSPPSLVKAGLAPSEPLRIAPREGLLVLAPSHYHHRTIPFVSNNARISFAFDVVRAE